MLMSFATIFSYCVCAAVSLKVLDFQRISDDVERDVISTATADSGILLPSSFVICTSHYQKRINASFNSIFVLYADEELENRWFTLGLWEDAFWIEFNNASCCVTLLSYVALPTPTSKTFPLLFITAVIASTFG